MGKQISGCQITSCQTRSINGKGYACSKIKAYPSPLATPSPTTLPLLTKEEFMDRTQFFGSSEKRNYAETADDGVTYDISFDVNFTSNGIVSFAAVTELVTDIQCYTNGSVRIMIPKSQADRLSLSSLYPNNSILVVPRDQFGVCLLQQATDDSQEQQEKMNITKNLQLYQDAYLRIEDVSGSVSDAIITGSSTSYFSIFDQASINIIARDLDNATVRSTARKEIYLNKSAKVVNLEFSKKILPDVTVKGIMRDSGGIKSFRSEVNFGEMDIEVVYLSSWVTRIEVVAAFKFTLLDKSGLITSLPVPGLGIQNPLNLIPSGRSAFFPVPALKIGIFIETYWVLQASVVSDVSIVAQGSIVHNMEKARHTISLTGTILRPSMTYSKKVIEEQDQSFDLLPIVNDKLPPGVVAKISASVFAGVRPKATVYFPLAQIGLSVDVGTEIKGESSVTGYPPFSGGTKLIGVCETCHQAQVNVNGKIQGGKVNGFVGISEKFAYKKDFKIPLAISLNLVKLCLFKLFGEDNTMNCGPSSCCDSRKEEVCENPDSKDSQCVGPSPSPSPTTSTSSSPSPSPTPSPTPGTESNVYTDPHLRTFDGLSFDCQGSGEFVLSKSDEFEIRARFSGPDTKGSVTKGLASTVEGMPVVQLSVPSQVDENTTSFFEIGSCGVRLYIDRKEIFKSEDVESDFVSIKNTTSSIQVQYKNGLSYSFSARNSAYFGCYLEFLKIFIPTAMSDGVIGLMGSPNQNRTDDWMSKDGKVITQPKVRNDFLFETAYNYCTENWCVSNETDSLFSFENGTSFSDFNGCATPYNNEKTLADASPELRRLCGDDAACIVDGLASDQLEEARNALRVQSEVDQRSSQQSRLKFDPSVISVDSTLNILIRMNYSDQSADDMKNVEAFAVYVLDSDSGEKQEESSVLLLDDGSATSSDEVEGDFIYTNDLAVRSSIGGERFMYRAIPVISGVEVADSNLTITNFNAVRSYSFESGIGDRGSNSSAVSLQSLDGLELMITYSWPTTQKDLDIATQFESTKVGYQCPNIAKYTTWESRDNTNAGGRETVVVQLDKARQDGVWSSNTMIKFFAGWYTKSKGEGPATLRMVLRDSTSKFEVPRTDLSQAIDPGQQSNCSETLVAYLQVSVGNTVSLKLQKS